MAKVKNTTAIIDETPELEIKEKGAEAEEAPEPDTKEVGETPEIGTEKPGAVIDETPGPETKEVVFVVKMGFANQSGWHEVDEEYVPYSDFDRKALLRAGYIEVKK